MDYVRRRWKAGPGDLWPQWACVHTCATYVEGRRNSTERFCPEGTKGWGPKEFDFKEITVHKGNGQFLKAPEF